jgi:microcystin-dependent protein
LLENGAAVSRTTYSDLFAAIGTTYGAGDGSTTFNLPDSRGRVGVNISPSDAEFNTMGEKYGEKAHTLTYAEMPSHTHGFTYAGNTYAAFPYTGAPNTSGGLAFSVGTTVYGSIGIGSTGGGGAHNVIQPSIVKTAAIKYALPAGTTDNADTTPGTSISGYWTSAPAGYLAEDGSAVSRTTYATLFSLIGTTYGAGDGSTTFNLPDSRGRVSVNKNPADAEFATIGEKYGEKTHTLSVAELAAHSHNFTYSGSNYGSFPYTGSPNTAGGLAFSVGLTTYGSVGISSEGNGQPYNVIQPSIVKMYAIKY